MFKKFVWEIIGVTIAGAAAAIGMGIGLSVWENGLQDKFEEKWFPE